jgi:hypothetical protein
VNAFKHEIALPVRRNSSADDHLMEMRDGARTAAAMYRNRPAAARQGCSPVQSER